ncbi:MAG: UDP-N-acetylmuramoyl-L-alanyl-D-glutamate--2,6-diaminopimelate ligase [Gemmatimonadota bacterium]|nr:UDP-N-acetylmuramoyl-L-alanyl-D-glutamate--2,6-diaminopimelate ligase [Gemmatimonadota bacterium]
MRDQSISSERVHDRLEAAGVRPHWVGDPPSHFTDLSVDSRDAGAGHLFVAVRGTRVDGHSFVDTAARAGASAAVVEQTTPSELPQLVVSDSRRAIAVLAMLFSGDPGDPLRLIGITGTNGKSTTAWLVRWVLAGRESSAAVGTLGVVGADGVVRPGSLTTPDPIALGRILAGLREDGVASVALEASSHALVQRRIDGLRFAAIAYTSFSREHLEYHADLDSYRAAKLRLVDLLEDGGICAVNQDEPAWRDLAPSGARTLRYGLDPAADICAIDVEPRPGSTTFRLATPGGDAPVRLPLPAEFNVRNALAAAAVSFGLGHSPIEIAARLSSSPAVPGRMEVLRREPTLVFRDYAHTPDSYERVLSTLRGLVPGRVVAVFGCGGERDPGKRPLMGEIATRLADLTVVTTDNPRSEDPAQICGQVVDGLDPETFEVVLDRREAIEYALAHTGPDDAVVLLGKGHENYQIVGEEKLPFDEAAIVEEISAGATG